VSLTGCVSVDLSNKSADEMRAPVAAACAATPRGAELAVNVGALLPEPEAVRVLRHHVHRINITIHGTGRAVRLWVEAIRDGMPGELPL
jgi:hypothetical protein